MTPHGDTAQAVALAEIENWLRESVPADYDTADKFADALLEVIERAFRIAWDSDTARATIKAATEQIYSFYRLRDETPFGETGSPVILRFGAADTRAIRFFDSLDHWYFSKYVNNLNTGLRQFLKAEYLEKGAALFGRETPESLDDFRQAAGGKLANINDRQIRAIVTTSVQRVRNWAHVGSLHQAGFELAEYEAILDARTTEICRRIDGVRIRVATAQTRIQELTQLAPGDFAAEVYESTAAREYQKDPVTWIEKYIEDGVVSDDALKLNIGIPPLHINCRTRLRGVFTELEQ